MKLNLNSSLAHCYQVEFYMLFDKFKFYQVSNQIQKVKIIMKLKIKVNCSIFMKLHFAKKNAKLKIRINMDRH